MSFITIINVTGIFISVFTSAAVMTGFILSIKSYKERFDQAKKYFAKFISIENYYFNNKSFFVWWVNLFAYIIIPILVIVPGTFITISIFESFGDSLLWMIAYIVQYIIAIILFFLYLKKYVVNYANAMQESSYNYARLKNIEIKILPFYNFDIVDDNKLIMRNNAFQMNFDWFEIAYTKTKGNEFKQYRVVLKYLARFASIIDSMKVGNNWTHYKIISITEVTVPYTTENIVENVVLTMQRIISDCNS